MITARLDNWSCTYGPGTEYQPPEIRRVYLAGTVVGHPRKEDGTDVVTSHIVASEGRMVTTASGTVYELGDPSPEYVAHCRETLGREIDPEQPVVVHRRGNK